MAPGRANGLYVVVVLGSTLYFTQPEREGERQWASVWAVTGVCVCCGDVVGAARPQFLPIYSNSAPRRTFTALRPNRLTFTVPPPLYDNDFIMLQACCMSHMLMNV